MLQYKGNTIETYHTYNRSKYNVAQSMYMYIITSLN